MILEKNLKNKMVKKIVAHIVMIRGSKEKKSRTVEESESLYLCIIILYNIR